jgi:deoxyribodipyrimidine photo-lyase
MTALSTDVPANLFAPTRAEGLRRLQAFLPRAGARYAAERNSDLGPRLRGNVSMLSPYLRHRLLTEFEVVRAVLALHGAGTAEKFVQEVLWRTYWKGWLQLRPAVWTRYLDTLAGARAGLAANSGLRQAVQSAEDGRTGIEGFDDWAQELVATGYLHNHARMWFASIWIFTLRLPWALGADFFARHLLDADPASNTLGWRWVGGLQTPGKTYLAQADNIARYSGGRFKPKGLATHAEALTESPLPRAQALPARDAAAPAAPALLLVHAEDLDPPSLLPASFQPAGVVIAEACAAEARAPQAAAAGAHARHEWPWGDKAQAFVHGACLDLEARLVAEGHAVTRLPVLDVDTVLAAAKHAGTRQVLTPEAPVGPVADALDHLETALAARGIALQRLRRAWDSRFWPHASRGFFAFREHITDELRALGLPGA